jgi:hypothetical protein
MFSLTSTVASAKLTSKVRPHPFAPAPRTRFRSRDLERERFPTQKARYNEWIFSFLFFWRLGRFFSAPTKRWITRAENPPTTLTTTRRRRERGGMYFFTPSRRKRARNRARKCSRDSMRPSTRGRRRRVFVVVPFFRARAKGAAVWILNFLPVKGGKKLGLVSSFVDLFRCPIQQRTRADRDASLFPSPTNGRTNEQVNFKTSRTATKARAGFSVNAAAVRLPFCIYISSDCFG